MTISEDQKTALIATASHMLVPHIEQLDPQFVLFGYDEENWSAAFCKFVEDSAIALKTIGFRWLALELPRTTQWGVTKVATGQFKRVDFTTWYVEDLLRRRKDATAAQRNQCEQEAIQWCTETFTDELIRLLSVIDRMQINIQCVGYPKEGLMTEAVRGLLIDGQRVAFFGLLPHTILRSQPSAAGEFKSLAESIREGGIKTASVTHMTEENLILVGHNLSQLERQHFIDSWPRFETCQQMSDRQFECNKQCGYWPRVGEGTNVGEEFLLDNLILELSCWTGYFWHVIEPENRESARVS